MWMEGAASRLESCSIRYASDVLFIKWVDTFLTIQRIANVFKKQN